MTNGSTFVEVVRNSQGIQRSVPLPVPVLVLSFGGRPGREYPCDRLFLRPLTLSRRRLLSLPFLWGFGGEVVTRLRVDLLGARFNTTMLGEHIILEAKYRLSVGCLLCTLAVLLPNVQISTVYRKYRIIHTLLLNTGHREMGLQFWPAI